MLRRDPRRGWCASRNVRHCDDIAFPGHAGRLRRDVAASAARHVRPSPDRDVSVPVRRARTSPSSRSPTSTGDRRCGSTTSPPNATRTPTTCAAATPTTSPCRSAGTSPTAACPLRPSPATSSPADSTARFASARRPVVSRPSDANRAGVSVAGRVVAAPSRRDARHGAADRRPRGVPHLAGGLAARPDRRPRRLLGGRLRGRRRGADLGAVRQPAARLGDLHRGDGAGVAARGDGRLPSTTTRSTPGRSTCSACRSACSPSSSSCPLVYLPLERLWEDVFTEERLTENAKDLVDRASGGSMVLLVVMVCVGAPLVEELVYRGLLQGSFAARVNHVAGVAGRVGAVRPRPLPPGRVPGTARHRSRLRRLCPGDRPARHGHRLPHRLQRDRSAPRPRLTCRLASAMNGWQTEPVPETRCERVERQRASGHQRPAWPGNAS